MSKEVPRHEQLTFDFDEEYPSLLEPIQKKEKKLGVASADLIPLKIKLINFYFEKGDVNNVYRYIKNVIELIHSSKDDGLPLSNYFEQLSSPANFVDQNIPEAGMVDQLNKITALKIIKPEEDKLEGLGNVIISLKTEQVNFYIEKGNTSNVQEVGI